MFTLPPLPYTFDGLAPAISREGVQRHYEDNHAMYTRRLNEMAPVGKTLGEILGTAPLASPLYNMAAQYWAHNFWWDGMRPRPRGGGAPTGAAASVVAQMGTYAAFKRKWVEEGSRLFGSGWLWLTLDPSGQARILALPNAIIPQRHDGSIPVLVSDLWEHAYYCQYGTNRTEYLSKFFDVVFWPACNERIAAWERMKK